MSVGPPTCLQSLAIILGYIIWKKQKLLGLYNEALNSPKISRLFPPQPNSRDYPGGQSSLQFIHDLRVWERSLGNLQNIILNAQDKLLSQHGVSGNSFFWKETRYVDGTRFDCSVKEKYYHFYLDSRFDNDTYSYQTEEINRYTGQTEQVTYQIEPIGEDNFEQPIITAVGKRLEAAGAGLGSLAGIQSVEALESAKPVPSANRLWTIGSKKIAGRLIGGDEFSGITIEGPYVTKNGNFVKRQRTIKAEDIDAYGGDRQYVIANKNNLTYKQQISHIILYKEYYDFSKEDSELKATLIKLYQYLYDNNNNNFNLKRASKKLTQYEILDHEVKQINVSYFIDNDGDGLPDNNKPNTKELYVTAKVRRTTSDGCTSLYWMNIGKILTTRYDIKYYAYDDAKWKPEPPCGDIDDIVDLAKKQNIPNDINAISAFLDRELPLKSKPIMSDTTKLVGGDVISRAYELIGVVFGTDTLNDTLLEKLRSNMVEGDKTDPIPPPSDIEFGVSIQGTDYFKQEFGWETIQY